MHTQYYKEYTPALQRDMEFKVYGHAGLPFIVFPCQDGKYFDFESRGMIDTVQNYIEEGRLQLFCIGCVDEETWSAKDGDHRDLHSFPTRRSSDLSCSPVPVWAAITA